MSAQMSGQILVLGKSADMPDFTRYATKHQLDLVFADTTEFKEGPQANTDQVCEKIFAHYSKTPIKQVITFHDRLQLHAEKLMQMWGLPVRNISAIDILTDKSLFKSQSCVQPFIARHIVLPAATPMETIKAELKKAEIGFPLVVKPSNAFYSAGVTRANNDQDMTRAVGGAKRVCSLMQTLRGGSQLIFEQYIDGDEFAIDGFIQNGKLMPTVYIRKFPDLSGPSFHEYAYIAEPFDAEKGKDFFNIIQTVLNGLQLESSPFHAEFRKTKDGRLYLLEIAPRLSGNGATADNLLQICHGVSAYGILIGKNQIADVQNSKIKRVGLEFDFCAGKNGFIANIEKLIGFCETQNAHQILPYAQNGKFVMAPPVNFETVLTVFFTCNSPEAAQSLAQELLDHHPVETTMEAQQ